MQLLLTVEELRIVARVLEKCLAQAQAEGIDQKREAVNRMLDRVIEHDLRFSADELDDLAAMLAGCRIEMRSRIAAEKDDVAKASLREQQKVLEHAADKVTEACAMA